MELNYDCIRDVLLEIEKVTTFDKSFTTLNGILQISSQIISQIISDKLGIR